MAKSKQPSKKTIRVEIAGRLEKTFGDFQEALGKTKFRRNIKKASKALAADLKDIPLKSGKSKSPKQAKEVTMDNKQETASQ